MHYVIRAAEMALAGEVDAVVTGPIHKEAVRAGGFDQYIGNTEIFEDVCTRHTGQDFMGKCMTMLITKSLRVAHATRHVPFGTGEVAMNTVTGREMTGHERHSTR